MERPIPIDFVIGSLRTGGAEGQLVRLIEGLDRDRFRPEVAAFDDGGPNADRLRAAGVPVVKLPMGPRLVHPKTFAAMAGHAARLRRERTRIVHAWLDRAIFFGILSGKMAGVEVLIAAQRNVHFVEDARERSLHRFVFRAADLVIGNSEQVRHEVRGRLGVPEEKCEVVYNGVDLDRFDPRKSAGEGKALRARLGVGPDAFLAVAVANFFPVKNHRLALSALALARREADVRLLFVGDGPERRPIEREAKDRGLSGAALFVGPLDDVRPALAAADAVALFSRREGFSNALLEGMAMAKPVVATEVGGAAEAAVHGATGLLFPSDDAEAAARALSRVAKNRPEGEVMGRAGRERAEELFSLDRMVRRHQEIYEKLLKRKTRK